MRLITFDFHNTLAQCDTWFDLEVFTIASKVAANLPIAVEGESLNASYRNVRKQVMRTGIEISAAKAVEVVFAEHALDVDPDTIVQSVDRLMSAALHDLVAMPGAVDTVNYLKSLGYQLGVISSAAHHDFVEWSLAEFGVLDQFDFVLTSVSAGFYKSDPRIYETAMGMVDAVPSRSLHIGDSKKWDVEVAARAGMRTGWLNSEQHRESSTEPDLIFETLHNSGPTIDAFVRNLS